MPNTLAHMGVQGLATQSLLQGADLKWIYIGCILPDIPWILQRFVRFVLPDVDLYTLRLYAVVQSSLCFCLVISLALGVLSAHFLKTFAILSLNSFFHLFLDACQRKWANGVHFLAPFDWDLNNFGLFWPESLPTYLLTAFGLVYFMRSWRQSVMVPVSIKLRPLIRPFGFIVLLAIYFVFPILLLDSPEQADNHFVKTLRMSHDRPGRPVEFDRASYLHHPMGGVLKSFAGEELAVEGMAFDRSILVSVRGTFVNEHRVRVSEYHVHAKGIRDGSSYLGLGLVTLVWVYTLVKQRLVKNNVLES
jgi:hypothetical protein